jgi:pimeloyl-ACP methyl ester carboxylesterase
MTMIRRTAFLLALLGVLACTVGPAQTKTPRRPSPLYLDCRGARSASPTVILESGAFGTSTDWDLVLDDLAHGGLVCAYDRAGVGDSPPRDGGETVTDIARELGGLLDTMGETRPIILVGHSNGALYAEAFAALWPQRVMGLVYVNGVTSDDLDYPLLIKDLTAERHLADLAVVGARLGLSPLVAGILTRASGLRDDAARRKREALKSLPRLIVARDEDRAIVPGLAAVRQLGGSPPGIPTAVIVGATEPDLPVSKAWRAAESASALRAKTGWVLYAPGADHISPLLRDRAYVLAAVNWLRSLAAARAEAQRVAGAP